MDKVDFIIGNKLDLKFIYQTPPLNVFSEEVLSFFDDLSKSILKDKTLWNYPNLIAFGNWCRKDSLIKSSFDYKTKEYLYLGRGILFHIVPSNVSLTFAYSLASGLIAGNINIVRLPSREFTESEILCSKVAELIKNNKHRKLNEYVYCIRYPKSEVKISESLSRICDIRVIWGGDKTITEIRKAELKPKAYDIVFSDRYSISLIDSTEWLREKSKEKILQNFFYDTYLTDQKSCSSPCYILWIGDSDHKIIKARDLFWKQLKLFLNKKNEVSYSSSIIKLEALYKMVSAHEGLSLISDDNIIVRVWSDQLNSNLINLNPGYGFFIESGIKDIQQIAPLLKQKCQTISYFGIDKKLIQEALLKIKPLGVDRVVPIGKTLDFSLVWDGYDLIKSFSRKISIA